MENAIRFKITLDKAGMVRAARTFLIRRENSLAISSFLLLLGLIGLTGLILRGLELYVLIMTSLIFGWLIYIYLLVPVLVSGQVEKTGALRREVNWQVNTEQISLESGGSLEVMDWNTYQDFLETGQYFFLLTDAASWTMLQMIPKTVFASQVDLATFRELLEEKFRRDQPRNSAKLRKRLLVWGILIAWVLFTIFMMVWLGD